MPYGISKFAVEQLARDYRRNHGIDAIHLRTCWVYGPGLPRARVPKTLVDAAVGGRKLHVASGGDFRVDHVYIDDLVDGVLAALDKPEHRYDVYHMSSGEAPSLFEIVDLDPRARSRRATVDRPGPYLFGDRIEDSAQGRARHGARPRRARLRAASFGSAKGLAAYIAARRAELASAPADCFSHATAIDFNPEESRT